MSEEKIQGGVQSLEVGLSVLDALVFSRKPMMLKELAEKLSMHPAKVHRYVVSLVRMNYAKQLDDGRYTLGEQAWRLGLSCIQRTDVIQAAQPMINELHRKINCGLQISKWTSQGPLIVQWIEPDQPVSVITRVGSIMPLLNSATGRAYAVFMAEEMVRPLLEQEWQQKQAQNIYPANWTEFLSMKQRFIEQGAATVSGDMLVGVNAICAPIFNAAGEIEFCIAALGSENLLPIDFKNEKVKALMETARALTDYIAHG
ncbi:MULTISPECIES: IclR family transcriptional regulator [unclassified Acinetobacter]|uniref:IclR family transcriptional regulator n=1 Tax=unclassified Acinetobacter TaxID=196816 RepID=UPI0029349A59|nr:MULTISPECIES: IclR family transcriptional regulator [unclassified Acinetobacter]WOE33240.1 IclR family transcriptional regulator [Acinetobacter sp. SAAs470]WOE36979.1 IclR family transcriptional regulator [Acinetobacter sp. SAAs474]